MDYLCFVLVVLVFFKCGIQEDALALNLKELWSS